MTRQFPEYEIVDFYEKKTKYCIAIPLLNEGERILNELRKMNTLGIPQIADIIILDGGSTDGSTDHNKLSDLNIRTLLVKKGPGKQGAQFRMGFDFILNQGYEGVITIDGNDKDSVESIPLFIEKLESGYDFIQGSRFVEGGVHKNTPFSRLFAVKIIHAPWISLLSRFHYTDTTSAYRGISRVVLEDERLDLFREIFSSYELLFYMSAKIPRLGYRTIEIPVCRYYPLKGKTPTKIKMSGNLNIIKQLILLSVGSYDSRKKK